MKGTTFLVDIMKIGRTLNFIYGKATPVVLSPLLSLDIKVLRVVAHVELSSVHACHKPRSKCRSIFPDEAVCGIADDLYFLADFGGHSESSVLFEHMLMGKNRQAYLP